MAIEQSGALPRKKNRFLQALVSSPTIKAACESARIGERTGHRWLAEDAAFREAFRSAKAAAVAQASATLAHSTTAAADVLREIAVNGSAPFSSRVTAASKLLEIAFHAAELELIVERLERVEALLIITEPKKGRMQCEV